MTAKLEGLNNIFTDTPAPKRAKTPKAGKKPTVKRTAPTPKVKPTTATAGRTGRPVELDEWRKVTVILEERQIDALDAAAARTKAAGGARVSYSEMLRWLVDTHLNGFKG